MILNAVKSEKWSEWEYAMCHLQKQKMIPRVDMSGEFLIHKDKFLSLSDAVKIQDSLLIIKSEPVEHNQKKRLVKSEALKRVIILIDDWPVSGVLRMICIIGDKFI